MSSVAPDKLTDLTVTMPTPPGWQPYANPNLAPGTRAIAKGDTYPMAMLLVFRLTGDFDVNEAIKHGYADAELSQNFKRLNASTDNWKGFPSSMIEGSYDLNGRRMHSYNRIVIATGAPPANQRYLVQFTVTGYAEKAAEEAPDIESIIAGFNVAVPNAPIIAAKRIPAEKVRGLLEYSFGALRPTRVFAMSEWTAADLPSFAGRTVIVTGANSGLGLVTARELARVGAKTILAVRNTAKGDEAAAGMTGDVEVRKLDLQDLASVRAFADGVDGVDVLVNNAGIMAVPYAQTVDGFESQIGTNHLGHFALTNLLLPKITDRVVTVSSLMHLFGYISLKDLNWKSRPYSAWLGLRAVQAGQPAVHQRAAAPPRRGGVAVEGARRASRLLRDQPAGPHRKPVRHAVLGRRQPATGHRRRLRRASDAVRRVPGPAGRQLHRAAVRDAGPDRPLRPQPAGPRREEGDRAVGAIRAAHGH